MPESRIREVQVGQPVVVELWSAPGQRLPGRVREISPAADPQARTFLLRLRVEDPEGRLLPGTSARARISLPATEPALAILTVIGRKEATEEGQLKTAN